jgi:hypothetical protein
MNNTINCEYCSALLYLNKLKHSIYSHCIDCKVECFYAPDGSLEKKVLKVFLEDINYKFIIDFINNKSALCTLNGYEVVGIDVAIDVSPKNFRTKLKSMLNLTAFI